MTEVFTQTLAGDHVTPVRAYASLRSFAPSRSSFLIEAEVEGERSSIVGYRALGESLYPPGAIELAQILEPASLEASSSGLAARLLGARVGYIAYEAVHAIHRIEAWEHEGSLARMMSGMTIALFNHERHTVTIAGRSRGAVNRAAWEMTHGPELSPLAAPDPAASPEYVDASVADPSFAVRLARAQRYVAGGEVDRVVLSRSFVTPLRNADPLDVYRALRVLEPAPYLYFIDFADTPFAPGVVLVGSAALPSVTHTPGGVAPESGFDATFPAVAGTGTPRPHAMKIVRELETAARGVFGGAIGYILPDGSVAMAAPLRTLSFQHGQIEIGASTTIFAGNEVDSTRLDAAPALAAVRAAQDAVLDREKAEEVRLARIAAKEQAESRPLEPSGEPTQ